MRLSQLWQLYEADIRVLGFSSHTLKAYCIQYHVLIRQLGDIELEKVSYFSKQELFDEEENKSYSNETKKFGGLI